MTAKLSNIKNVWKTIIGLEVHAQLNSKTKLFSVAPNVYHTAPNSSVAYFDMATPGTLPIINSKCVELAILAATLLKCEINLASEFDRKHYFYSDLPAGYQITQSRKPIGRNGKLKFSWIPSEDSTVLDEVRTSEINIAQIQIEQDSGKTLHNYEQNTSLIDLNRAGLGLLEIVTDSHFENAYEAVAFVKELRDLFKQAGICTGQLEHGELRVDVNVSVKAYDSPVHGVRSEVKNISNYRGIFKAIEFESKRHIEILERGESVINETRFYNTDTEITYSMRDKENIQDYRYLPEPNLSILRLQGTCVKRDGQCIHTHSCVPCIQDSVKDFVYTNDKREILLTKFAMLFNKANSVLSEPGLYNWIISVAECIPSSFVAEAREKWLKYSGDLSVGTLLGEFRGMKMSFAECPLNPQYFADLISMYQRWEINAAGLNETLRIMLAHPDRTPESIIEENKFAIINDVETIEKIVKEFFDRHPKEFQDYKAGKKRIGRFFKKTIKSENRNLINSHILDPIIDRYLEDKN